MTKEGINEVHRIAGTGQPQFHQNGRKPGGKNPQSIEDQKGREPVIRNPGKNGFFGLGRKAACDSGHSSFNLDVVKRSY
jgi:hypothetical protein